MFTRKSSCGHYLVGMEKIPEDWATRSHSPPPQKGAGEGPTTVRQTARFPRNIQSLPMGNHAKNQDFLYSQNIGIYWKSLG